MKPKVLLLATGGTIASRYDPALKRTVAMQKGEDLLELLPGIDNVADIELVNFATIPSFDMTLSFAFELARKINESLARSDVQGVVVTHGTDTMEETSYLADLLLQSDKPAVFTGAQRANDDPQSDGPLNLGDAIHVAAVPEARGLGAMVCFNGSIHAARDVTKVHTSAVQTFQSYDHGALGAIDRGKVVIYRRPTKQLPFKVDALEERVALVRLAIGVDLYAMEAAIERGVAGIVIEAFGRGNAPTALTALVRKATERGVVVLVTSRCPVGRVEPIYGGGGGGADLRDAGAIFCGDLKGPKARLLLMVLLADAQFKSRVAETICAVAP